MPPRKKEDTVIDTLTGAHITQKRTRRSSLPKPIFVVAKADGNGSVEILAVTRNAIDAVKVYTANPGSALKDAEI